MMNTHAHMPNNLDIDLKDVLGPNMINGYGGQQVNDPQMVGNGSGQVDMNQMQGMFGMGT